MKFIIALVIILHGLIHLMGFAKAFQLAEMNQLTRFISKPMGTLWLIASLLLIFGGIVYLIKDQYAWLLLGSGLMLSQILIVLYWHDAKIGTIANLLILPLVLTNFGVWNFEGKVNRTVDSLIPTQHQQELVDESDIRTLPSLIQFWLHNTGVIGKPLAWNALVMQAGEMKSSPDGKWSPFTAQHWASFEKPGFVWHARMDAGPGLHVAVLDRYVDGKGSMLVKMQSLVELDEAIGVEINEGAMQRYLAEMVWIPSFALSPHIRWEQIDNLHARATMKFQEIESSVTFTFNARGLIIQCEADRYYYEKGKSRKERWVVNMDESGYKNFNGILIPAKSSITWKLENGDYTWFKMEIKDIQFNTQ